MESLEFGSWIEKKNKNFTSFALLGAVLRCHVTAQCQVLMSVTIHYWTMLIACPSITLKKDLLGLEKVWNFIALKIVYIQAWTIYNSVLYFSIYREMHENIFSFHLKNVKSTRISS